MRKLLGEAIQLHGHRVGQLFPQHPPCTKPVTELCEDREESLLQLPKSGKPRSLPGLEEMAVLTSYLSTVKSGIQTGPKPLSPTTDLSTAGFKRVLHGALERVLRKGQTPHYKTDFDFMSFVFILCACICLHVHLCATCVPSDPESQDETLKSLGLELQTAESRLIQALCKGNKHL